MIVEVGVAVALTVGVVEYFTNSKFRSAVNTDLATAKADIAVLKTKAGVVVTEAEAAAKGVVASVEADIKKL